jgi:hypothetical protein
MFYGYGGGAQMHERLEDIPAPNNPKEYFIYGQSRMKYQAKPGDIVSFSSEPGSTHHFVAMCQLYPGDEVLLGWPSGRDPGEVMGVRRDGQTVYPEPIEEDVAQSGPLVFL